MQVYIWDKTIMKYMHAVYSYVATLKSLVMEFDQGSYTQDFKEFAQEHLYLTCSCKEARTCNEPHLFVDQNKMKL